MKQIVIDFEKLKGAVWGKQPQVAAALGIHPHTLSSKMNRKSRLHLDELNTIARALRRDTSDFIMEVEIDDEKAGNDERYKTTNNARDYRRKQAIRRDICS